MKKRVKIQLEKKNLYFTILKELNISTNLKKIQKKLSISKQKLNYYLREMKKRGLIINKGRGWYEPIKKSKNSTQYGSVLVKDSIRGHAYVWNIELPKKITNWEKRISILSKKNINYKLVGILKTTPRIKALGRKVWLCNNHIRIFDKPKQSYHGKTAKESKILAYNQLLEIVRVLENKLGFMLKPFKFKINKEHYALIKNDLAIHENRKGIIMRIKENGAEWLLIDDSLGLGGELENIGKKAYKTNIKLQKWWNEQKQYNFKVTPTFIVSGIDGNRKTIKDIIKVQEMEAHNIIKHQKVLDEILSTFKKINKRLDKAGF